MHERFLTRAPGEWSWTTAAAVPPVSLTAYHGLVELAGLGAGERVLVRTGAGGVGMAAIQPARHLVADRGMRHLLLAGRRVPDDLRRIDDNGVPPLPVERGLALFDAVPAAAGPAGRDTRRRTPPRIRPALRGTAGTAGDLVIHSGGGHRVGR